MSNDLILIPESSSLMSSSGMKQSLVSRIGINQPLTSPVYWELPKKVCNFSDKKISVIMMGYLPFILSTIADNYHMLSVLVSW